MTVRLHNCIWQVNSMKRDKTSKMWGELTLQYKHSANFLGDDVIVNKSSHWRGKPGTKYRSMLPRDKAHCWPKVWKKSPFVDQRRVFLHWRTSAVMLFFEKSLTFAWNALSGFQSTGSIFLFYAPNFCLDRPFGFSVHQDALYCLCRLFRFST